MDMILLFGMAVLLGACLALLCRMHVDNKKLRIRLEEQEGWLKMLDEDFDVLSAQLSKLREGEVAPTEREIAEAECGLLRLLDELLRVSQQLPSVA